MHIGLSQIKKPNKKKCLLVKNTIIFLDFDLRMPSYDQT